MLPVVKSSSPKIILPIVDFPEPDSPTMPTVSPRLTEKLTFLTASNATLGLNMLAGV